MASQQQIRREDCDGGVGGMVSVNTDQYDSNVLGNMTDRESITVAGSI